jgi:hypothetical protein
MVSSLAMLFRPLAQHCPTTSWAKGVLPMNTGSRIWMLAPLLILAGFAMPFSTARTPQAPNCLESYTVSQHGACTCNGAACTYWTSIHAVPYTGFCGNCHWTLLWENSCSAGGGSCSTQSGNMNVDLDCDPHKRSTASVWTPCPSTGSDWIKIVFTCGYCQ